MLIFQRSLFFSLKLNAFAFSCTATNLKNILQSKYEISVLLKCNNPRKQLSVRVSVVCNLLVSLPAELGKADYEHTAKQFSERMLAIFVRPINRKPG